MAEKDFVTGKLKFTVSSTFSLRDVYGLIISWCKKHNFDSYDKENAEFQKKESKDTLIKIEADRIEDEYHKSRIKVRIMGQGLEHVKRKDQMAYKGKITVIIEGLMLLDYQAKWDAPFTLQFLRALWDKYTDASSRVRYTKELYTEVYDLYHELQSFFRVEHFKR